MARASHKIDLLNDGEMKYKELIDLVESFSEKEQEGIFGFEDRDKNIRDVLIHLHEWHNMMKKWYVVGCIEKGNPDIPREGYTFKTLPEMNKLIWSEYQHVSFEESLKLLSDSHEKIQNIINKHSNEELFLRNQYNWTKESTLGSYFASATASHYEWAITKIKKYKRGLS